MRIALASDHAGFALKRELAVWLAELGYEVTDLGASGTESVDYPDFGNKLANAVATGAAERGIAVCGSGIGISIAVNRNPACRCALVNEPLGLLAALWAEKFDQMAALTNFVITPLSFLSGTFYSIAQLPEPFRRSAWRSRLSPAGRRSARRCRSFRPRRRHGSRSAS